MKICLFLFFALCASGLSAQERALLKGKVAADSSELEGVYVVNRGADYSVTTGASGFFSIPARVGDTLVFSAVQFIAREVVLKAEDFNSELFVVRLENMVNQLQELVIVDYRHINAETLGLVPKGQKQYTPAERKVYTATNGVDALFNAVNGRTKALKKAVDTEKKEMLMAKINNIFTEEEIMQQFKVPQEYVQGFIYYIVEDKNFAQALKEKNDNMARFLMSGLASRYLKLIADEK